MEHVSWLISICILSVFYFNVADDFKCDVWSLGVISYILLSGTPPFNGNCDKDVLAAVAKAKWHFSSQFVGVSEAAKDFISCCLTVSPEKRPTSSDLLEHAWFNILKEGKEEHTIPVEIVETPQVFAECLCGDGVHQT